MPLPSIRLSLSPARRGAGLRTAVERLLDAHAAALPPHFPGAFLGVRLGSGERVERALAGAGRSPVGSGTAFQVMSISKPVTALGVLRLAQLGALDLDAPITTLLRSWAFSPECLGGFRAEQITPRLLLCHAGGVNIHGYGWVEPDAPRPAPSVLLNGGGVLGAPLSIVHAPGSRALYSGGGYTLLQQVIEDATGRPFAAVMREVLFQPLGMSGSAFDEADRCVMAALATPHNADGMAMPHQRCAAAAATGLYTTPADLLRFLDAVVPLQGAPGAGLVPPKAIAAMTSRQATDQEGRAWATGFYLLEHPGQSVIHHGGHKSGWWGQIDAFVRARHLVVALTDGDAGETCLKPIVADLRALLLDATA